MHMKQNNVKLEIKGLPEHSKTLFKRVSSHTSMGTRQFGHYIPLKEDALGAEESMNEGNFASQPSNAFVDEWAQGGKKASAQSG